MLHDLEVESRLDMDWIVRPYLESAHVEVFGFQYFAKDFSVTSLTGFEMNVEVGVLLRIRFISAAGPLDRCAAAVETLLGYQLQFYNDFRIFSPLNSRRYALEVILLRQASA